MIRETEFSNVSISDELTDVGIKLLVPLTTADSLPLLYPHCGQW